MSRLSEVEAAPPGPQVAAIFDLDGTLLPGYTVLAFLADQLRRREVGVGQTLRAAAALLETAAGSIDVRDLIERGIAEWAGRSVEEMTATGERLLRAQFEADLYPEMRAIIAAHRRRGHTVLIASSATRFQVEPIARALGIEHRLCTALEQVDGKLTGKLDGPLLYGAPKAEAVRAFASTHGIGLGASFFYANGDEDEALMHLVGHPRPTNPQAQLARVAQRRGWPVERLASRGWPTARSVLGNVSASASVLPLAATATLLRVLTGSRREAANLLTASLPALSLALGGVKLSVRGEQHLWSHRPAVFIWNHRNSFDAQIAAKLVSRDFGAVAKKELSGVPLFALASAFLPIAFVNRADHRAALEALEPVTRLLHEGCSMLVAPEGTRVAGATLGEFKKGAFRMAMAAGVPIVPIVIYNADDIGPRDSSIMRPATVEVEVLPPIKVADWEQDELRERIAGVRQLYLERLTDTPRAGERRRSES